MLLDVKVLDDHDAQNVLCETKSGRRFSVHRDDLKEERIPSPPAVPRSIFGRETRVLSGSAIVPER